MNLTEKIKAYALDIGYHAVGITTADPFDDHLTEVTSRSTMYDFYSLDPRRFMEGALVQKMMPQARSIICMALDYARTDFPAELVGKIGRIYQARCYGPAPDRINGARYGLMVKFLESLGAETGKGFSFQRGVPQPGQVSLPLVKIILPMPKGAGRLSSCTQLWWT